MKRFASLLLTSLMLLTLQAQISPEALRTWHSNKFSLFIHFGLYSQAGGVWNGQPVTRGYSEQIQAFAPIPKEAYHALAQTFNPDRFNADSIVALAQAAGMRSIIFTTKHHDGFCMFHTETTPYNSYHATPGKRDFVKELSEACQKKGINFGLYYSLIDWSFPEASPMSGHNADFIPDAHHAFTKKQLTELLTRYGKISELWFDMGANTPEQSRELYQLVHQLQPDCMVSGRLGNDQYDFCVMGDNAYPESSLQTPWQSAASMFNETWGYRSWQERGDVREKAKEKLKDLISVAAHGGNYLLNIGPKGDGSVVPFEKEVLMLIGQWLNQYGYAIYDTEASPFRQDFSWGQVTRKGKQLFLFLSGVYPQDGKVILNLPGYKLIKGDGKMATYLQYGNQIELTIPASAYNDGTIHVLTLDFDTPIQPQLAETVQGMTLTARNATPHYSYSCFDYYSNYRSTTAYSWEVEQLLLKQLELIYTEQEAGKTLDLTIDNKQYTLTLDKGKPERPATNAKLAFASTLTWGQRYVCGLGSGMFESPAFLQTDLQHAPASGKTWVPTDKEQDEFPCSPFSTYFVMQNVYATRSQHILMEVGAGNGIEVYVNGKSIMKHLNPYRCTFRTEKLIVPLQKGDNQIVLRAYNRFEGRTGYLLRPAKEQVVYRQEFTLPDATDGKRHTITVRPHHPSSAHTDAELSNLRIRLRRVAL